MGFKLKEMWKRTSSDLKLLAFVIAGAVAYGGITLSMHVEPPKKPEEVVKLEQMIDDGNKVMKHINLVDSLSPEVKAGYQSYTDFDIKLAQAYIRVLDQQILHYPHIDKVNSYRNALNSANSRNKLAENLGAITGVGIPVFYMLGSIFLPITRNIRKSLKEQKAGAE